MHEHAESIVSFAGQTIHVLTISPSGWRTTPIVIVIVIVIWQHYVEVPIEFHHTYRLIFQPPEWFREGMQIRDYLTLYRYKILQIISWQAYTYTHMYSINICYVKIYFQVFFLPFQTGWRRFICWYNIAFLKVFGYTFNYIFLIYIKTKIKHKNLLVKSNMNNTIKGFILSLYLPPLIEKKKRT